MTAESTATDTLTDLDVVVSEASEPPVLTVARAEIGISDVSARAIAALRELRDLSQDPLD